MAQAAARLIRERRELGVTVAATKSSETDVVTETDREVEELIRSLLGEARPDDGVVGEEGDDEPGATGVRWIVDPIDGTVNFLYGIPQYAVSVAAERDGVVVAGVVLDVARDTAYVGRRETGAGRTGHGDGPSRRQPSLGALSGAALAAPDRDRLQLRGPDPRDPGGRGRPAAAAGA